MAHDNYDGMNKPRELVCDFGAVPLDDDLPDYTAVSYCWDDQTEAARLKFSDGRSVPLSQTLSDLFRSLQKQNSDFTVWIDPPLRQPGGLGREDVSGLPDMARVLRRETSPPLARQE
ncbi:hypothetical protein DL771_009423 [Monosporascus sp. 5C6A]|nr:hypothetical protein DL771_009423 [Monosporascus sp. 5C6A]